jgi:hypothetical protein
MVQQNGVRAFVEVFNRLAQFVGSENERWHEEDDVEGQAVLLDVVFGCLKSNALARSVGKQSNLELVVDTVVADFIVTYVLVSITCIEYCTYKLGRVTYFGRSPWRTSQ